MDPRIAPRALAWALGLVVALGSGCSSAYYAAMEQIGKPKREILVDRVRSGQADQRAAEEQFLTTYELFKQATNFEGGDIEAFYEEMQSALDRSEDRATRVSDRIRSIEQVAGDLFTEWKQEIGQISSSDLRQRSQKSLALTQDRYDSLIRSMKLAESRMDPVLVAFRDQVLFLKHNLNARAIASLQGTAVEIQGDVDARIRDMQASIREAESFLESLEG